MTKKITCTRCLGKGYVDNKDLKRLKRKSVWDENSECKFCKGKGTITENFASKHNPNSEKFPNVNDNFGLITNEEMNEQYREFKEKFSGKILDSDEKDDLISNSQYKTIYWTALITIILTLSVVLYFNKEFNEGSEIEGVLKGVSIVIVLLFVPATIIYRLMFGKIDREDFQFYYPFLFFTFFAVSTLLSEPFKIGLIRGSMSSDSKGIMIGVILLSLLITKLIANYVFFHKKTTD
jgi:hypothetical protein